MKISIIGSGNIGSALVSGLLRDRTFDIQNVTLADVSQQALASFASQGVRTVSDNREAVKDADTVILCVKPYLVHTVMEEIREQMNERTLTVSFAAGITLDQLIRFAGTRPIYRMIPNTAMSVNRSMTCMASRHTDSAQDQSMIDLFNRVGKTLMIDESLMNAATVLASCGTAFALRYLRAATVAGVETGFRPEIAAAMVAQTMSGAAALLESGSHPEEEIDKVTTPKGITVKGLNALEHAGFSSAIIRGILASYRALEA